MKKLIVFTGSGISVESGVPTYRADKGLWHDYDVTKVCNIKTWLDNYNLVHEFYNKRRMELGTVKPNPTHEIITEWQKKYHTLIVTQNVDNLHEQAGTTDVIHLHGELTKLKCMEDSCGHVWDIGYTEFDIDSGHCPACGNKVVKPAVVFFGEQAPKYSDLMFELNGLTSDDVVVVMGTSGQVVPIDYYLLDKPGYKILNNLDMQKDPTGRERAMNGFDCWNQEIYLTSSEGAKIISKILKEKL